MNTSQYGASNTHDRGITRRTFAKSAAVLTGVAMSGMGYDFSYAEGSIDTSAPVEKRYTFCDMCNQVPRCGMVAYVQDNKIVRIESRENHPVSPLCAKGLACIQELYDPNRITTPLRRTNPKGTGVSEWEPISWDEALDTIAEKFQTVKEESGPDAVMFYCGDPKEPRPPLARVATLFGTSSYGLESSLCSCATNMSARMVYGTMMHGIDPSPETKSCLIWSLNAAWSQPNRHAKFMKRKEDGCKFVIVDPRITPTVTGLADIHLQLRPGSDGALALGFINVLIRDGLVDKEFVNDWTIGFEGLAELAAQYPPEKVEEITWVPADKLVEAVHLIAENAPSTLVSSSAGLAHSSNVGHSQRAVFMIPALLGMIDKKGGMLFPRNLPFDPGGSTAKFRMEDVYNAGDFRQRRHDREDFPVWQHCWTHMQTARLPEYIDEDKIRAALLVASNAMIWPETNKYQEAIGKLEFAAAIDYYERPWTHDYVDILLPAAMCTERSAPAITAYGRKMLYRERAVEPMGECREDWQIILDLGCRLGFEEECFGGDIEKAQEYILETAGLGITLNDLREHIEDGIDVPEPNEEGKYLQGKLRKDGEPGFNTPSGKIEFDSEILKSYGFEGLPVYEEPVHTPFNPSEEDKPYPLVLNTGSRLPFYTHSKLREIPWLNQFQPDPVVRLHPKDARERGIANGDDVRVFNAQGEVQMKAEITNMVLPGVVDVFHGWAKANINLLISRDFCPITGYPPFRSSICEIEKIG